MLLLLDERWTQHFMDQAVREAEISLDEGGIPIGSVLVVLNEYPESTAMRPFFGHNQRVQQRDPILHAEMDCLRNAGRLKAEDYQSSVLFTTLSPCDMCSGAILLYKIPFVVIGENETFRGPEEYLKKRGVTLIYRNDPRCIKLMQNFIKLNPKLWNEDIGK